MYDPAAVMDFEVAGAWLTAPPLLDEFEEEELWSGPLVPFRELAEGARLSQEHVRSGEHSLRWDDHPRFPTLHTSHVPRDWSGAQALSLWVHSGDNTGQKITLAVAADNEETPWRDYYLFTFAVDWAGWRRLVMPLADFTDHGSPAGWDGVSGVFLFTKIFNRLPNPYTVLHLDDMRLETGATAGTVVNLEALEGPAPTGRLRHTGQVPEFDGSMMNHRWPELRGDRPALAPIQYESYFKTEAALFGYYPRFQPGFVSFSPTGRAFIQYGMYILQTRGEDGLWRWRNLLEEVLEPYARAELGFAELGVGNSAQVNDVSVAFDADGDAYMMAYVWDPTGDWRTRTGLLLHSRDDMLTWDVYRLPYYMARFEKFTGHNHDRLRRPPVILLSAYFAPTTIFITIPEKQPDGTLVIPEPVKVAEGAMPFIPHSGEANNAITVGDQVFVVYGTLEVLEGKTAEDGAPAYAVVYDIPTRTLSEPVLMGFGGINAKDDHNWPAIALDSRGHFHVVINGHADPFVYVRSLRPLDITEWTEPEKVAVATSYAGLLCDANDTLYTVTRNSDPGYYFRLSLHRKRAGEAWEAPRHLVLPFKNYYKIWFHKLVMDGATGRLFLSYYSQSTAICVFKDEYLSYVYVWPDRERGFLSGPDGPVLPQGADRSRTKTRKYQFYSAPPGEPAILMSDDGGDTWRLAVSEDFR